MFHSSYTATSQLYARPRPFPSPESGGSVEIETWMGDIAFSEGLRFRVVLRGVGQQGTWILHCIHNFPKPTEVPKAGNAFI